MNKPAFDHPNFRFSEINFKCTGPKPGGHSKGCLAEGPDGKTYMLKYDTKESLICEMLTNLFLKKILGDKYAPSLSLGSTNNGEHMLCSKWINKVKPLNPYKINDVIHTAEDENREKLRKEAKKMSKVPEVKDNERYLYLIHSAGRVQLLKPSKPPKKVSSTTETPSQLEALCDSNTINYKNKPIQNFSKLITLMKILDLYDLQTDHILLKDKGTYYRPISIDSPAGFRSQLSKQELLQPCLDDVCDTAGEVFTLNLPYLIESEVWETVQQVIDLPTSEITSIFNKFKPLLAEEEINERIGDITAIQQHLKEVQKTNQ